MLFDSIMHVTFYCEDLKRSVAFYEDLGCQIKMAVKYKSYLNRPDHPFYQKALDTPDDYCIVYMEVAPGQFIELFPKKAGQSKHLSFDEDTGYSHFGTLVKDISATRDFLVDTLDIGDRDWKIYYLSVRCLNDTLFNEESK